MRFADRPIAFCYTEQTTGNLTLHVCMHLSLDKNALHLSKERFLLEVMVRTLKHQPAINLEHLSGYKRTFIRDQKRNAIGDILHRAHTS